MLKTMINIKPKNIVKCLIAPLAIGAASCTDSYLEINSNPYEPGDLSGDSYKMNSQLNNIASCVMSADVNTMQFTDALLGGTLGGYFSDANAGFAESFARYNPKDDWSRVFLKSDKIVPTLYANLNALEADCKKINNMVPFSVATIIKIAAMSRVTDTFGPIPYLDLGKSDDLYVPYNSQQEIYHSFLNELTEQIDFLKANSTVNLSPLGDYVYSGDITKWIKFANSLKLRLAMRISFVEPQFAKQMAEEAVRDGVIESNADNACWNYFKSGSVVNGLYVAKEYNSDGCITGGDTHAAADIICYMNGYNDPRRAAYFVKSEEWADRDYIGLRRGWEVFDKSWGFNFCGLNLKSTDPYIWLTAAEVAFLKAEGAAIHNFDMGKSAADLYNEGIRLSFEQWGVSGAATYAEDATSRPAAYIDPTGMNPYSGSLSSITVKWNDADTPERKLERIITQKWIALYLNGNEAWAELRRTGYPQLIPVAANLSGGIVDSKLGPQRMPYPQEEYTNNSANVTSAVNTMLGGPDNQATKLWWAKY